MQLRDKILHLGADQDPKLVVLYNGVQCDQQGLTQVEPGQSPAQTLRAWHPKLSSMRSKAGTHSGTVVSGCFWPPWDVWVVLGCLVLRSDVL